MLDATILVAGGLSDGAPSAAAVELLTAARSLTSADVVAVVSGKVDAAAWGNYGAARVLVADYAGADELVSAAGADAVIAGAHEVKPALILLGSDHRAKEIAGRAAVKLASACIADAACLEVVDQHVRASKLVLSGSWNTTFDLRADSGANPPLVCLRAGAVEAEPCGGAAAQVETLVVSVSQAAKRVEVVSHSEDEAAAGPQLAQARTVVVGGRGVDGDFDLVRSLAQLLNGAVGATRVACDEGWIERSAQVGQTGETIAPRLYIGLGVSGAVHHTSGIQGAGTIVAICDDSEAPIFEMADFGVVGDVSTVVPQLIEELAKTR